MSKLYSSYNITENHWDANKNLMLLSRNDFEYELFKILFPTYVKEQKFQQVEIIFPTCVSRQERWRIHTYSEKNMISSESTDIGENKREMVVILTKSYVEYIHNIYISSIETEETININIQQKFEIFKRSILDDIMALVDKHLNEEFYKYYV